MHLHIFRHLGYYQHLTFKQILFFPLALRIIKHYYQQIYASKFDNIVEMDQFLKRHNLPNS